MALSSETRRSPRYIGTGLETIFPFAFKLLKPTDIEVRVALSGQVETTLEESAYTVVLNESQDNNPGGTVTLKAPLAKDAALVIISDTPYLQPTTYTNRGGFYPEQLNTNLDRLTILTQQLKEHLDRTITVPPTSPTSPQELFYQLLNAAKEALESAQSAEEALAACEQIRQLIEQYSWDIPHIVNSLRDVEQYPYDGLFAVAGFGNAGGKGQNISNRYVKAEGSTELRTLGERFADVVNVRDFGAVGDGVTDDTEAIQTALNAAKTSKKICFGEGTFLISETVQIDCSCNFSAATFNVHGATVTPAIKVGQTETTHSTLVLGLQIFLPRVVNLDAPSSGFTGIEDSIGVQVLNLFSAEVHVPDIKNFYRGLYLTASQTGNAWNTYFINALTYNKFNLDITPIGTGWVNQNLFIGGRFRANETSETDKTTQINLRKSSSSSGNWGPNNNVFIGCDLGDQYAEYAIDCNACYNYFYGCRYEYDTKVRFKAYSEGDLVAFNQINGGLRAEGLIVEIENSINGVVRNNEIIAPSKKVCDFFGSNNFLTVGRSTGSGIYLRGYGVGANITQAKSTDTNWLVELSTQGLKTKAYASTPYPNVLISSSIKMSSGDSEAGVEIKQLYNQNVLFSGESLISVAPESTGTVSLGRTARLWSQLFASTATINTSDARTKTSVSPASDVLLDAWGAVPIHTFQFTDAVEKKGTDFARLHVGVVAQEVASAFQAQGLDAARYGLFCHDEWQDEYETIEVVDQEEVLDDKGNVVTPRVAHTEQKLITAAGDRYGIRYEEALCLEAAYQRRRADRLEERLAALEKRMTIVEAQ